MVFSLVRSQGAEYQRARDSLGAVNISSKHGRDSDGVYKQQANDNKTARGKEGGQDEEVARLASTEGAIFKDDTRW